MGFTDTRMLILGQERRSRTRLSRSRRSFSSTHCFWASLRTRKSMSLTPFSSRTSIVPLASILARRGRFSYCLASSFHCRRTVSSAGRATSCAAASAGAASSGFSSSRALMDRADPLLATLRRGVAAAGVVAGDFSAALEMTGAGLGDTAVLCAAGFATR